MNMTPSLLYNLDEQHKHCAVFHNPSLGIILYDSAGSIVTMNPFALALFNYAETEIIGHPIETLIPRRLLQENFTFPKGDLSLETGLDSGIWKDRLAVKKDGTELFVEISLSSCRVSNGAGVMVLLNDITLRKSAEQQIVRLNSELEIAILQRNNTLKDTLLKLEVAQDKLLQTLTFQKAILDSAGMIIVVTDENGIIKLYNPEAEKKTGYTETEVLNKQLLDLFIDAPGIAKKRRRIFKESGDSDLNDFEVLTAKAKKNTVCEEEFTVVTKEGLMFPVSVTITCIRDAAGVVSGFMGIAADISVRKNAEKALHAALKKEKEISQMKSKFVSIASHEFRTPLSTVISSTYLIGKYITTEDQSKRERHLSRIVSSANLLTHTLDEFLSAGRIDEGFVQVKPSLFNVVGLIKSVKSGLKKNIKQHIIYHHSGTELVFADESMFQNVVNNLMSNSGKFSPPESTIEINTSASENEFFLSVKDAGIGISEDDQKNLMERFFRGSNVGNIPGTGLGLHIVSKYAELMNAQIACKSKLNIGTEFTFQFKNKLIENEKDPVN